jgi:tetratricopeptide (TPR) repeat protein
MTDPMVDPLRAAYRDIAGRLDGAPIGAERDRVKQDIIRLFKTVDKAIGDLSALKEEIRTLVDRYKQLAQPDGAHDAPAFAAHVPVLHADHIGASTYIEKGWSLISLGDHAGAIQALSRALALSPGNAQAESLLGWAQMLHEEYDAALTTFESVLNRDPTNSLARINVGYVCLKKHMFSEAIEHLSKAIRLDNDKKATLYAHYYLGLVYLAREMYDDAQTFLEKTVALGPNLIEAYYELGRARWFGGDRDRARQAWTAGFDANRLSPWGKRCRDVLDLVARGQAARGARRQSQRRVLGGRGVEGNRPGRNGGCDPPLAGDSRASRRADPPDHGVERAAVRFADGGPIAPLGRGGDLSGDPDDRAEAQRGFPAGPAPRAGASRAAFRRDSGAAVVR